MLHGRSIRMVVEISKTPIKPNLAQP